MLELVRYQKEVLPKAAGCEDVIYSSNEMFLMESRITEKPYLGIVKKEKSDIVKTVNQSGTHLECSLSIVFLQ